MPTADNSLEALANVSEALRRELHDALVNLDTVRMVEAIRGIAEQNPALADALVYHANQLAYTKTLNR